MPIGRSPVISATRFCTICSATTMSVDGIELRRDFRRAADALRPDSTHAGHRHDDLLDRPGHDQRHRLRRQCSRVRDDDDARELQRRIDAAGQGERGDRPADDESRRQQNDRARLPQWRERRRSLPSPFRWVVRRLFRRAFVIARVVWKPGLPVDDDHFASFDAGENLDVRLVVQADLHRPSSSLAVAGDEHRRLFALADDRHRRNQHDAGVARRRYRPAPAPAGRFAGIGECKTHRDGGGAGVDGRPDAIRPSSSVSGGRRAFTDSAAAAPITIRGASLRAPTRRPRDAADR